MGQPARLQDEAPRSNPLGERCMNGSRSQGPSNTPGVQQYCYRGSESLGDTSAEWGSGSGAGLGLLLLHLPPPTHFRGKFSNPGAGRSTHPPQACHPETFLPAGL